MYSFTFSAVLVQRDVQSLGCRSWCEGRLGKLTFPCGSTRSKGTKKTPTVPLLEFYCWHLVCMSQAFASQPELEAGLKQTG